MYPQHLECPLKYSRHSTVCLINDWKLKWHKDLYYLALNTKVVYLKCWVKLFQNFRWLATLESFVIRSFWEMKKHVLIGRTSSQFMECLWGQTLLGISQIVSFLQSPSPNYPSLYAYLFMLLRLLYTQSPKLKTLQNIYSSFTLDIAIKPITNHLWVIQQPDFPTIGYLF